MPWQLRVRRSQALQRLGEIFEEEPFLADVGSRLHKGPHSRTQEGQKALEAGGSSKTMTSEVAKAGPGQSSRSFGS